MRTWLRTHQFVLIENVLTVALVGGSVLLLPTLLVVAWVAIKKRKRER